MRSFHRSRHHRLRFVVSALGAQRQCQDLDSFGLILPILHASTLRTILRCLLMPILLASTPLNLSFCLLLLLLHAATLFPCPLV